MEKVLTVVVPVCQVEQCIDKYMTYVKAYFLD